jgi:hypothetical protein
MLTKILLIVFAIAAGAGGAAAYDYASVHLAMPQEGEKDEQILRLEGQLAAVNQKLDELSSAQDAADPQAEILAARLSALENRFAEVQERRARQNAADGEGPTGSESAPSSRTASELPADSRTHRISGEELVAALKDLPEEGVEMIKDAIRKEVEQAKKRQQKKNQRAGLERKAEESIQKAATALSLSPVQVEQAKDIAARFIDRIIEIDRIARERSDPAFARNAKKELEVELRAQVVEILTPEQLDKARELDPEGIGKQYPRGF